jgi:hypothetical protein
MNDNGLYKLQIRGEATESELNSRSPIHVTVAKTNGGELTLSCVTDQSGLIGLIRQLHSLGFLLLTLTRMDEVHTTGKYQS